MKSIAGTLFLPNTQKIPESGICAQIWAVLMAAFMAVFTLFRSVGLQVTQKLPDSVSDYSDNIADLTLEPVSNEDFRPPSPAPGFTEADLLSSVLKKLGKLEEKVDMLQEKPFEMPYEKVELLNAAVYRVDALEAELIATKKVIVSLS